MLIVRKKDADAESPLLVIRKKDSSDQTDEKDSHMRVESVIERVSLGNQEIEQKLKQMNSKKVRIVEKEEEKEEEKKEEEKEKEEEKKEEEKEDLSHSELVPLLLNVNICVFFFLNEFIFFFNFDCFKME